MYISYVVIGNRHIIYIAICTNTILAVLISCLQTFIILLHLFGGRCPLFSVSDGPVLDALDWFLRVEVRILLSLALTIVFKIRKYSPMVNNKGMIKTASKKHVNVTGSSKSAKTQIFVFRSTMRLGSGRRMKGNVAII